MVANGFKRKNVPVEYFKARKDAKKSNVTVHEPDDLNWSFVYNNILEYVKRQQAKYLAHIARRPNTTFIKRLLFADVKRTKRGRPISTLEDQVLSKIDGGRILQKVSQKRRGCG